MGEKTMNTTTIHNITRTILKDSNFSDFEIRYAVRDTVEYLPRGLERDTLLDVFREVVRDNFMEVFHAETERGAELANEAAVAVADQPTIEQVREAIEALYPLFDRYSGRPATGFYRTGFDTILSDNTLEFSMAVEKMAQDIRTA
jgi:hypothetical protein